MASDSAPARVLILGAHPDDAEVFAGGMLVRHCNRGSKVRVVSVTDGRSGHHEMPTQELIQTRRQEGERAAATAGAEFSLWDFHDGSLMPDMQVRSRIIREIREFEPDLILTHRTNDYHPDHRAVGLAVQDASYMVTVPKVCPDTAALRKDPIVAFMTDLFTRPNAMRPDVILDVTAEFTKLIQVAACHKSQFFEWLAYHDGVLAEVPEGADARQQWLQGEFSKLHESRQAHFIKQYPELEKLFSDRLEVFEVSEYARQPNACDMEKLFPSALSKPAG